MDVLPPELATAIFRFLAPSDLRQLSLVCAHFRALCQALLFRHVAVILPNNQNGNAQEILDNCTRFVERLTGIAESPTLAPLVQSLRYADRLEMGRPSCMAEIDAFKKAVPSAFFPRVPLFTNLQTLTLWDVGMDVKLEMDLRSVVDVLPRLRHLHIHQSRFSSGAILPLDSFTFSNHSIADVGYAEPLHVIDPQTIRRLVLRNPHELDPFFRAWKEALFPRLQHLEIHVASNLIDNFLAFLTRCPALESLVVDCFPAADFQFGFGAGGIAGWASTLGRLSTGSILALASQRLRNAPALSAEQEAMMAPYLAILPAGEQAAARQLLAAASPSSDDAVPMDKIVAIFSLPEDILPNLRTVRCPFALATTLLCGRNVESLSLFRSSSEDEDESPLPAIRAAGAHAPNLRTLRLLTPVLTLEIDHVMSTIAQCLPHLRTLSINLQDVPRGIRGRNSLRFSAFLTHNLIPLPLGHQLERFEIRAAYAQTRHGFDVRAPVEEMHDPRTQLRIVDMLGEGENGKALKTVAVGGVTYTRERWGARWVRL